MSNASGKLVILGILTVALAAAGISWWFRFHATHRAAKFWGPEDSRLIRDASTVMLYTPEPPDHDISSVRGLVHLRSALLEDRSFNWPPRAIPNEVKWEHGLSFRNDVAGHSLPLFFSSDFHWVTVMDSETMLSCEPIAAGLREMFAEFRSQAAEDSPAPSAR